MSDFYVQVCCAARPLRDDESVVLSVGKCVVLNLC